MAWDLSVIDREITTWMADATSKQFDLCRAPDTPVLPFGVVYPLQAEAFAGSMEDEHEDVILVYQATLVGSTVEQARALSDRLRLAWVTKANGSYVQPMELTGVGVQYRQVASLGTIIPAGEDMQNIHDTYRLKVGR